MLTNMDMDLSPAWSSRENLFIIVRVVLAIVSSGTSVIKKEINFVPRWLEAKTKSHPSVIYSTLTSAVYFLQISKKGETAE